VDPRTLAPRRAAGQNVPVPTAPPPLLTRSGLAPQLAVALELGRALLDLLLGPLRLAVYLLRRRELRAELAADLASSTAPGAAPPWKAIEGGELRLFLSCAEPSGELHARNLLRTVGREAAARGTVVHWSGLGGPGLATLGLEVVGDPVARAAMGFGVIGALPFYLRLLVAAARELRDRRPDALVAVDSPALHVPLGHLARRYGVPVVHFVTPQYWAWAPWRVGGYRRAVDRALSILPFEPRWFARHGVPAAHVGHPIADALATVPRNPDPDRGTTLALLPGSRASVIARNLPWMLARVARLRERRPDLRVVLPHERGEVEGAVRDLVAAAGAQEWAELRFGGLHAALAEARAAFSVSGTVLLDLLHHRLPTVVVYRLPSRLEAALAGQVLTVPYFSSVNLLTGRETFPEYCFAGDGPEAAVEAALERLWADREARRACAAELELAAARLGGPGSIERAAAWVLATASAEGGGRG
jgi:lipid-A-disaccharide synthase